MLTTFDACSYPLFRQLRAVAASRGQAAAASFSERGDLSFGGDAEMEPVQRQYVSGEFFDVLGLRPALGRVLHAHDDVNPGAHPVAVLSHDYWVRRFGSDPEVVGRTFRMGGREEIHTATFGPQPFLDGVTRASFEGNGLAIGSEGAYPTDPPQAGPPAVTPTAHGNGFVSSGILSDPGVIKGVPSSFTFRFPTPGTYQFECLVHPDMKGSIVVTP